MNDRDIRSLVARLIDNESSRSGHIHVLIENLDRVNSGSRHRYECIKCYRMFVNRNGIMKSDLDELRGNIHREEGK